MGLFGRTPKVGGFMDVIRCDEPTYLIWKWHPVGSQLGDNNRENAIRWGSSLRVKDGEVAVFVYNQPNGVMEDFIEGPYDQIIKTENFPILASIIGLAYEGGSPFQAEIYFINLARIIQVPFAVPFFDVYDPRYLDFGVPTAVRGKITFNIKDYRGFVKLHRLSGFELLEFQTQIRDAVARYVKGIVTNIPVEKNIPVVQIEREIATVNESVGNDVRERLERDYGVNIVAIDINAIEIDKTSPGYQKLMAVTQTLTAETVKAQAEVNIKNLHDMQRINAQNMEETLRIQREEAQYAQRKQTQSANFAAYQMEQQAAVGLAGAQALGQMGANGTTEMPGGGTMNPAAMMAGMAMGGAIGQNMAGMINGMMQNVGSPQQMNAQNRQEMTPPPIPVSVYHVAMNGKATGPFNMQMLVQMACAGTLTPDSLVWKPGMDNWAKAGTVQELQTVFNRATSFTSNIPPIPPV